VNACALKQPSPSISSPPPGLQISQKEAVDIHRENSSETATPYGFGHLDVLGTQAPLVSHHETHLRRIDHPITFFDVHGHRFLAEDVFARLGRLHRHRAVQRIWSQYQYGGGAQLGQTLLV